MKRITVFALVMALVISSCQIKEENEFEPDGIIFTATMEAMADDATVVDTKTSMDSYGNVLWKKGDQVSIFVASTINQHFQVTDASDGKTAAALNPVESPGFVAGGDIPNNVAYYPYAATTAIAKRSGGAYLISDIALPATQNYAESSFGNGAFPMTAVTNSTNDYNLKFKNVLGGLKLQLKGTAVITSISVTGNNNDVLCGAAEVTVSVADTPAITLTDATATTVTLDCGDGVQLDVETATAFIIALPPMTMTGGFAVTVTDTENMQMEIKTTKNQIITRSNLLSMPAVTYEGKIGNENEHDWVDLGLPSGLKWATCNVGAERPEEYGDYISWGEIEAKNKYDRSTYKWCNVSGGFYTKYNGYEWFGLVDNKTILEPGDDVASYRWGGAWRMPTVSEFDELINGCNWSWTTRESNKGCLLTSKTNGKSIFLPAAGCMSDIAGSTVSLHDLGFRGDYWSSSLKGAVGDDPGYLRFGYSDIGTNGTSSRCNGFSVRPVTDEGVRVYVTGVSLNKDILNLVAGNSELLITTVLPSNATQPNVIWSSSDNTVATVDYTGKVTSVASGAATITAKTYDGGYTATCQVTVTAVPEAVDLGLTSGLKWASFNIGASAPEDYGDYFAWGGTEPHYNSQNPLTWKDNKTGYYWTNYEFRTSGDSINNVNFSKYNTKSSYGPVDNNTVLDPEDDAASVKWGGSWRMPTIEEWEELIDECTWTWTIQNGVDGMLVTGPNNNNIFLPAAGNWYDTDRYNTGDGIYWSSSLNTVYPYHAWQVLFYSAEVLRSYIGYSRYSGLSIRAVTE